MGRKPAHSKPRNDAIVEIGDAQASAVSISDFDKLSPPDKKSRESLRLSAHCKQVLRDYFEPQLAPLRAQLLDETLALPDLVANNPRAFLSLVAQTLVALDTDSMSINESRFLIRVIADCAVDQIDALRTRRAKQLEPLEKNRAKGALRNKQRAAEAHAQMRQIAWDLYERNPTWGVKEVAHHICNTAGRIQDRTYSIATIGRVINGVRQEWRKEFEARRKKTDLYTLVR